MQALQSDYPWTQSPLIASAPMRLISRAELAVAVSQAGGIGFLGAGSDVSDLEDELLRARQTGENVRLCENDAVLPIGVGVLLWGASLQDTVRIIEKPELCPAAIWLFAARKQEDFKDWAIAVRDATNSRTKVWIQVGTVADAIAALAAKPDVLVVQGQDAGGHGLMNGAGLIPLLPEASRAVETYCTQHNIKPPSLVAAGGIMDGVCAAAALTLGAHGICAGTRYLASTEASIAPGYQRAILRASDGGTTTVRSHVYDSLRGTVAWPEQYGGRGVINQSYRDHLDGVDEAENRRLYDEAVIQGDAGWDEAGGRLTTYAGTGVGLVSSIQSASEITLELRKGALTRISQTASTTSELRRLAA